MILAFHGATTMTSDLETDVDVSARAGFKALEIWAGKMDHYLETHTLEDLNGVFTRSKVKPLALNSIEFIAFRKAEYPQIQKRLHELGQNCTGDRLPDRCGRAQPLAGPQHAVG